MKILLAPLMLVIALNGCADKSSNESATVEDQLVVAPAAQAYVPTPATPEGYEEGNTSKTAAEYLAERKQREEAARKEYEDAVMSSPDDSKEQLAITVRKMKELGYINK